MKVEQTSLFGISQGDHLPPLFFLLMSLGWLVTTIESHEELILRPSGILMCESHCRLTVGCSRRVFNPENLSCSCKVSVSVAKDSYCKSFKGCRKGAKLFSTRKGKLVCKLIRTKTKKIESWKPSPKLSKRPPTCRKTQFLLQDKPLTGYLFPPKPDSIIYIKSIGVMVLSSRSDIYILKVFYEGSRLAKIDAYPASSLVKDYTMHRGLRSYTVAEDFVRGINFELIFLKQTFLAMFKKTDNKPRLSRKGKQKAEIGKKLVILMKKCVIY